MANSPSDDQVGQQSIPRRQGSSFSFRGMLDVFFDTTEPIVELLIRLCGWSAIVFVFAIFVFVFGQAFIDFDQSPPTGWNEIDAVEFFTSAKWRPDSTIKPSYGILALLAGTAAVTILAMVIAVPLGLGAAVYVSEFCSPRVRETLKIIIELLAAIPSVVWGFIGVVVIGPIIIDLGLSHIGVNIFNAGLILALMSVPVIVSVGEDALKAVPDSYREAALSLGANKWETVYRVLFPAAKNGLLAAVLLGVGRAIGETMAVLLATGHAVKIPTSLFDPARTLTATIASELGEAARGSDHYHVLFVIGVVLFVITFIVNLLADFAVKGIKGG
ncbi:MAG: phosphate transport system permease protein [Pirellulaceae bacterium]|jgi:phosphate transport system permease protein